MQDSLSQDGKGTVVPLLSTPPEPPRLRLFRNTSRMTVADLAEQLGVSTATILAWERGKQAIPLGFAERMADMFEVSTTFLLGGF